MSIVEQTRSYAVDLADSLLNGFTKQVKGSLQAPNGDENVKVFTAKGGSAVTLRNDTTSAAVIFDPEATLRNGQMSVSVFERDSSDAVIKASRVNIGRSTEEFISAGVLSSGIKVFNSSGVDVIGGTQTAAVLTSVPREISTITSTDVANFCANHERDLASGIVSRDDATMTMVMTDHFGKKMCLARTNTHSNLIKRVWDDGIGDRRNTIGESLGKTAATTNMGGAGTSLRSEATLIADTARTVLDTSVLTDANNPLTLATYMVDFDVYATFESPTTTDTDFTVDFAAFALDAAGAVVGRRDMHDVKAITSGAQLQLSCGGTITSSTVPISRVIVVIDRTLVDQSTLNYTPTRSTNVVAAYEETADIAARPIHVCVLEGLNASATINLNTFAVLTGVPDSTNVFISSSSPSDSEIYDTNSVEIFLRSISRALPRAFTVSGHAAVTKHLTAMYGSEEVSIAFQAMSFESVAKHAQKLRSVAHKAGKELADAMDALEPIVSTSGKIMSMLPGPVGTAGSLMSRGANAYNNMRS
uniref:Uncharacterized protein n=1 Tax=viral metagenome TaxID=1070528 RepID=A0A2V0RA81_9ZZZZ